MPMIHEPAPLCSRDNWVTRYRILSHSEIGKTGRCRTDAGRYWNRWVSSWAVTRCLIWQPSLPMYHVLHGDGLPRDTFYRYQ